MKITEGGNIEISIATMADKPAEFTLTLGGEEPMNIHLGPSMTDTIIIPVNQIEGIREFAGKKEDKIRLQEIILNLGLAKIKFGRNHEL